MFWNRKGKWKEKTNSLRNGCEIKDIAKVLEYKRIGTTEKYYISSTEKYGMNVIINLDKKRKDI